MEWKRDVIFSWVISDIRILYIYFWKARKFDKGQIPEIPGDLLQPDSAAQGIFNDAALGCMHGLRQIVWQVSASNSETNMRKQQHRLERKNNNKR